MCPQVARRPAAVLAGLWLFMQLGSELTVLRAAERDPAFENDQGR
jgi:hypothetical protein